MPRDFKSSTFVFVSSRQSPTMGRVERRMIKVMAALVERGSTVLVICAPKSRMADAATAIGVEVAPYHLDRFNFIRTRSRVRKYLQRHRPVVVHSTGLEADLIARSAARDLPTAAVNTITCVDWPRRGTSLLARGLRRWIDGRSLAHADAIVTDCKLLGSCLVDAGVDSERIMVDPPSIDIAEVQAQAAVDVSAAMPTRTTGPLVGYGGRMEASRGLEQLVDASAILGVRGTIAEVIIAGEGPLLAELKGSNRSSRVRFLGWVESVPAVLKELAVAVFPSVEAGVPTALLEAAALGRPIVASSVEGVSELFEDGREIRLVPPGDAKALAVAIADLVADREAAIAMGERARQRTLDEYSSVASIERHLALYRRFMKR